jgi:hypothetical protein
MLYQQIDFSRTTLTDLSMNSASQPGLNVEARLSDNPNTTSFTNKNSMNILVPVTTAWTLSGKIQVEFVAANMGCPPKQNRIGLTSISGQHIISYNITPIAGDGGAVDPSTPQIVEAGSTPSFKITANNGYSISDVVVDGSTSVFSELVDGVYTFSPVIGDHTLTASFSLVNPTVGIELGRVDKIGLLLPWLPMLGMVIAGLGSWLFLKRRLSRA